MARATRSAAANEKDKPVEPSPPARKSGAKKRKRTSILENGDQPATKHSRGDVKEEDGQEQDELPAANKAAQVLGSGDVPIQPEDAEKILDVLETLDTQGLLDRVFPLPTEILPEEGAATSSSNQTYSFRALLRNSSQHPLRVLRAAVQHLFPISSHPRSRPSAPAVQQLRFCNLALSLLDEASHHSSPIDLDIESIIPRHTVPLSDASTHDALQTEPTKSPTLVRKRKYALVQRLPTGDWWTSVNSDFATPTSDGKELKDFPVAHAELAAILPSASTSATDHQVTLASYAPKHRSISSLQPMPGPRRISCGRFLDYGPYSSFAPSFDQGGAEVGRVAIGQAIWRFEEKRRLRASARNKGKQRAVTIGSESGGDADVVVMDDSSLGTQNSTSQRKTTDDSKLEETLQALLPQEEVAVLKAALNNLELERAMEELLERNAKALDRLEELQLIRLGSGGGDVEPGSEEWDVAQGILESLTVLASLRPRSSSDESSLPLIPSPAALRKLHRTLPINPTQGWFGTLPEGRATALRDDNTVRIRSGTTVVPAAAPTVTPPIVVTTTKPAVPPPTYNPYTYSGYGSQYRGGYGTFTPGQTSSYYAGYANAAQSQAGAGTNYANQQYNATGSYTYPSWYNYQQHSGGAQAQPANNIGAGSGHATPQTATASSMPTNYASFFASSTQQPQPQRAVANTVLSATTTTRPFSPGTWGNNTTVGYAPPTLPSHFRSAANGSTTPGVQPTTPGGTYSNYYGNYQMASSASR